MHLITENGIPQIIAENYRLTLPKDCHFVTIEDPSSGSLSPLCDCAVIVPCQEIADIQERHEAV